MNTISEWVEKHYLQWQVEQGRRCTLDDFAAFLGFTRAYISMILNGSRTTLSMQTAYQIGERLGDFSILEILGYPVPDAPLVGLEPDERAVVLDWLEKVKHELDKVPDDERMKRLTELVDELPDAVTDTE